MNASSLLAQGLVAGYGERTVLNDVNLTVSAGHTTAIVGANACGKSTLLRVLSRLLAPEQGEVLLDGNAIHRLNTRRLAQQLGFLPQSPIAPEGISVLELVSRGRHPHQGLFKRWSTADEAAVAEALAATHMTELAECAVEELSGGQRQRAWIAMALTQQTNVLLLDEPTTFLDINHQIEVLDLLTDLNRQRGTTIVMVLHELNLAARYADQLVAMANGKVYAVGPPENILTEQMVRDVFGLESRVIKDPVTGKPMMIPLGRHGGPNSARLDSGTSFDD
ncbi:ABC transporter ATP-binding protein [Halomonas sp. ISL-60]|uniref:ABC transporter ATP-binding protein n=1 Tax=Halomonas sp. ISL-56 TaxID=2819149 RepID=UPI001BE58998|nr:ABC transporter ATP-binding protein [Halomonas sp. ISL-56]MBT2772053.1 ABC transporter ATP-binding protein [Halomonas sp. ISL-60]MBT2800491.1 ABC transporter ATP-binding protein [Halomonas sp. ISL-56]